jgi:hypothetical protein
MYPKLKNEKSKVKNSMQIIREIIIKDEIEENNFLNKIKNLKFKKFVMKRFKKKKIF